MKTKNGNMAMPVVFTVDFCKHDRTVFLIDSSEPIRKEDEVYHYITGEVYAPGVLDVDDEAMAPGDVRKMAYRFLRKAILRSVDTGHAEIMNGAVVVESFIARKGDPDFNEGAWVATVEVAESSREWKMVVEGKLNGFSAQFKAARAPRVLPVTIYKTALGKTELNVIDSKSSIPPHQHNYYIEFDDNGKVIMGITSKVNDHVHMISGTTATDISLNHGHRYFVGDGR